jgi:hypothetical protein
VFSLPAPTTKGEGSGSAITPVPRILFCEAGMNRFAAKMMQKTAGATAGLSKFRSQECSIVKFDR